MYRLYKVTGATLVWWEINLLALKDISITLKNTYSTMGCVIYKAIISLHTQITILPTISMYAFAHSKTDVTGAATKDYFQDYFHFIYFYLFMYHYFFPQKCQKISILLITSLEYKVSALYCLFYQNSDR